MNWFLGNIYLVLSRCIIFDIFFCFCKEVVRMIWLMMKKLKEK